MTLTITTSLKRKNEGGDYYRKKTKNLHEVIIDYMKMKGRGSERQEELKPCLANPRKGHLRSTHSRPSAPSRLPPAPAGGLTSAGSRPHGAAA